MAALAALSTLAAGCSSQTDAEIEAFYTENSAMMGGAELAQIKPRIRQHLVQKKQQQMVQDHIRDLGDSITIALSASWVETQAGRMLDNPLDRVRASGRHDGRGADRRLDYSNRHRVVGI